MTRGRRWKITTGALIVLTASWLVAALHVAAAPESASMGDRFAVRVIAPPVAKAGMSCSCCSLFRDGFESGDTSAWDATARILAAPGVAASGRVYRITSWRLSSACGG